MTPCSISLPLVQARMPDILASQARKAKNRSSLDHEELHNVVPKLHVSIHLTDP